MSDSAQPGTDNSAGDWADAGGVDDFVPGAARQVPVGERRVAVFRGPDAAFHALADSCPHAGAPLSEGALRDGVVVCTWHGFQFDPATGRCANVPTANAVATHAVRVENGRVLVAREPRTA